MSKTLDNYIGRDRAARRSTARRCAVPDTRSTRTTASCSARLRRRCRPARRQARARPRTRGRFHDEAAAVAQRSTSTACTSSTFHRRRSRTPPSSRSNGAVHLPALMQALFGLSRSEKPQAAGAGRRAARRRGRWEPTSRTSPRSASTARCSRSVKRRFRRLRRS